MSIGMINSLSREGRFWINGGFHGTCSSIYVCNDTCRSGMRYDTRRAGSERRRDWCRCRRCVGRGHRTPVLQSALIGGAAGGLTGALTNENQINLGKPAWKRGAGSDASPSHTSTYGSPGSHTVRNIQSGLTQLGYAPVQPMAFLERKRKRLSVPTKRTTVFLWMACRPLILPSIYGGSCNHQGEIKGGRNIHIPAGAKRDERRGYLPLSPRSYRP